MKFKKNKYIVFETFHEKEERSSSARSWGRVQGSLLRENHSLHTLPHYKDKLELITRLRKRKSSWAEEKT